MKKAEHRESNIEIENKIVELLVRLFVNRTDAYAKAHLDKKVNKMAYETITELVDTALIKAHIKGTKTIGVYQLDGSRVKWGCGDFDKNTKEDYANAQKLYSEACKLGLNPLFELSGGGEFKCHIWIFSNCEAKDMKQLLEDLCNRAGVKPHEIFPKQEQTTESLPYGNLVKLPLARHLVTKKRSIFLNDRFEQVTVPEAIEELLKFHLNNIIEIPEMSAGAGAVAGAVTGIKVKADKKIRAKVKPTIKPEKYSDFFDYVLNNELPAGISKQVKIGEKEAGINNNVLKNLGIWLFNMDYTNEDLKSRIKPVYDERKWSFGDLEGWYNKAKAGAYNEVNLGELILWCNNYYPNLRKLLPKTKLDDFYKAEHKEKSNVFEIIPSEMKWNIGTEGISGDNNKSLPKIVLPKAGKYISVFSTEVADILKDKNKIFFRADSREVVEIGKIKEEETEQIYTGFITIESSRFITLAETFFSPVTEISVKNELGEIVWKGYKQKSMSGFLANTVLKSPMLEDILPHINRILTVPLPIIYNKKLTFPKQGYDERFKSWMPYDSPKITQPDMKLEEANKILYEIFKEFCFKNKQDYTNAIAGLLTPFLRGLYSKFNCRTPLFFYLANRERCGKDYCAGITGITFEGVALEEAPISNSENSKGSDDELRKNILSAFIGGRKRLHFPNNKGFLNNSVLEGILTTEMYAGRRLGVNESLVFPNEIEFSLSGNMGIGFTPDLATRSVFVKFFYAPEDANARKFERPNLHKWVRDNRELILSALYSLVRNWIDKGCPEGKVSFASFPEWARVCGGVMEAAGYDSPCEPDKETLALGGDTEITEMKRLFEHCYEHKPNTPLSKYEIKGLIDGEDIFGYLDMSNHADRIRFGLTIKKYENRELVGITMKVENENITSTNRRYIFTKGTVNKQKSLSDMGFKPYIGLVLPSDNGVDTPEKIFLEQNVITNDKTPSTPPITNEISKDTKESKENEKKRDKSEVVKDVNNGT